MQKKLVLLICFSLILTSLALGCNNAAKKPDLPQQNQENKTDKADDELTASERRVLASRLSNLAEQVDGVDDAIVVVSSVGMTNNLNDTGRDILPGNNNKDKMTKDTTNKNQVTNRTTNINNQATNNANPNTVPDMIDGTNNVSGLMVMVGLSLDKDMNDAEKANQIKKTVANKLKASDKRISQVLVTTDPGLVQRLSDVAAGIIQGRPIQGYQEDINELTRSMRQQQPAF